MIIILIIVKIPLFREDNVFSLTVSLPYGSPVNLDTDYYQTFSACLFLQVLQS